MSGLIQIFAEEAVRLESLREYDVLDTPAEGSFDNITRIAQLIFGTPMAAISLIDSDRQWLKSSLGMPGQQVPRTISFCAHAIKTSSPFVVCDARLDERFCNNPLVLGEPHIRFYAAVPLVTADHAILGTLCVLDTVPRDGVSADHMNALYALSRMTVDALELRRLAIFDNLTNLLTRGAFRHAARKELETAVGNDWPLSCIILDVDHFKSINDTYGHAIGDAVLRRVAETVRAHTRSRDLLGRIGGEEFALMLPDTTAEVAMRCAERIRSTLATTRVTVGTDVLRLTASFGVASSRPSDTNIELVLKRADQALYQSKNTARNRVSCVAASTPAVTAA